MSSEGDMDEGGAILILFIIDMHGYGPLSMMDN